jgi:diguanylate cyclase (GGDEF)-like protein/PAS domain S-box-containing protein
VHKADLLSREILRNVHPDDMRPGRSTSRLRAGELHALLKSQIESMPEVAVLHVTDAVGNHVYSSLDSVPRINIADRYHFQRQRDDPAAGLVISPPLVSRTTGKWTLILTRRINFEDGGFAGISNVILNLDYFQQFYRTLNLGTHGVVALYDKERHLAARYPPSEKDMGQMANLYAKTYIEKGVKHAAYRAKSSLDGVDRMFGYRQVGDLPMFVIAGIADEDYLAEWRRHTWQYGIGLVILSLVVIALGVRQRRAEVALRQNESRFRYMLKTSPIAVRIASPSGRKVLFANRRYAELIESRSDQVLGVDPMVYYAHSQDYEEVLQSLSRGENITNRLVELLIPGGKLKWVLASYLNVEYGKESAVLGWFYDITERKRTEMALERSESTSRALINATTETAMLVDESGTVIAINEVGAHRLRREPDEIIGRNFYELLPPDIAQSRKEYARQVFQSGKAIHLQDVRDGIHFDINVYPVFDAGGKVVNLAIYAADVTEQLQLQGVDLLFHGIDRQVLRGQTIDEIFKYICMEVTRIFDYQYAWIGRKEEDGMVAICAGAGPASGFRNELEQGGIRWDGSSQRKGPTCTAIRTGQVQVFKDSDAGFQPWLEAAKRHKLKAILGLPLIIRGEIYGAFTVYSQHEHGFDRPDVLQRLSGIASRICIALESATDQQQLMLLSAALSATANGVFITNKIGHILWVNDAFTVVTGYGEKEVLGSTPRIFDSGKQNSAFYKKLWKTILRGEVWRNEMENRRKDGSKFFVRQTITPIRNAHGEISHFIAVLEDISAEKAAEARIEYMAHYDSLTNLPNRALFLDRLHQALVSAKRAGHVFALMFLDLDRFKSVNDTFGHHAGDLLLQQVAVRLRACVRESDTVARLAGDEFIVILPEIAVREDVVSVAEKIIAAFLIPFDLEGHEVNSSTSIGIALFPKNANDEEGMLKRADAAMYAAKEGGRNNFAFFEA